MNMLTKNQKKILEEMYINDDYVCFLTKNFSRDVKECDSTENDIHYLERHNFLKIVNKSSKKIILVRLLNRGIDIVDANPFKSRCRRKRLIDEVYSSENRDGLFMLNNFSDQAQIGDKQLRYDIEYLINEGVFEDKHRQQGDPGFAAVTLTDYGKRKKEAKRIPLVIVVISTIAVWIFQDFIVNTLTKHMDKFADWLGK